MKESEIHDDPVQAVVDAVKIKTFEPAHFPDMYRKVFGIALLFSPFVTGFSEENYNEPREEYRRDYSKDESGRVRLSMNL